MTGRRLKEGRITNRERKLDKYTGFVASYPISGALEKT
jgi:hypothetical protein